MMLPMSRGQQKATNSRNGEPWVMSVVMGAHSAGVAPTAGWR